MTNNFTCARIVLNGLATLAEVPESSRLKFCRLLIRIFRQARIVANVDEWPRVKTNDITKPLKSLQRAALNLEIGLAALQGDAADTGKRNMAGVAVASSILHDVLRGPIDIDTEIAKATSGHYAPIDPIAEYRQSIARLIEASQEAEKRAQERVLSEWHPRSTGDNYAFVRLVKRLVKIAEETGGHWTNYRDRNGEWNGTFIDALNILRPYLPKIVFPSAESGRVIAHILRRPQAD